jgi:hypothetical protein
MKEPLMGESGSAMNENGVFLSPRARRFGTIGGWVLAVLGVGVILGGVRAVQAGETVWLEVALWSWPLIFGLVEVVRARRVAVELTLDGVMVKNELRTQLVPWNVIEGARWNRKSLTAGAAYIHRRNGSSVRCSAFRVLGSRTRSEHYDFSEAVRAKLASSSST